MDSFEQSLEDHNRRAREMRESFEYLMERLFKARHLANPVAIMFDVKHLENLKQLIQAGNDCLTWNTPCPNCAEMWNSNYALYLENKGLRGIIEDAECEFCGTGFDSCSMCDRDY